MMIYELEPFVNPLVVFFGGYEEISCEGGG
jgi:hypothetical protein